MTKELYPSTPEGEDKLNETVDSFFDNPKKVEDEPQYSPEEIGGFKPIGSYSDGSPKYYGDKEESQIKEYDQGELYSQELSKSIYKNDNKNVNTLIEMGVIPQKKHLKLIQEMKGENIAVNPEIEKVVKDNMPQQSKGMRI